MSEAQTVMETIPALRHPEIEHPLIHADGVYFGLPDDEYHAAFALSSSGIKNLRISTLDFWACSVLNPDHEDNETEALIAGRAYHKRILEGRDVFYAQYAAALDPADYPDALRTVDDLKAHLTELSLSKTGKKSALIERLLSADPAYVGRIWDVLVEEHRDDNPGREFLPHDLIHRIEVAAAMIERHPQLSKAFSGGYPEVSVFWRCRDSGVPCKARFDYLKRSAIVDLKTFENSLGKPIDKAIAGAVASYKYHIQAAFYLEARRVVAGMIEDGLVFGDVDRAFLDGVHAATETRFLFIFQQKGRAPLARGKILAPGVTLDIGSLEVDQAKAAFARCWETYGADPWLDISEIAEFDATEFPAYIAD